MNAEILYSDADIVVVVKPPGVYVHPAPGHGQGTLSEFLVRRFPDMAGVGSETRPGVVHRLDAGTSGVMVFARTRRAYLKLRADFEGHERVAKTYLALLHGAPKEKKGTLEFTVGRKPWDARRMAVGVPGGKRAVTHWEVLARKGALALVEFSIETGRTHQIRLAAAQLGHPVVGDDLYGDAAADRRMGRRAPHLMLHAVTLEFDHPVTGRRLSFSAPPPPEMVYAC